MPELPEVETIKRVIEPQIQGLTIERITLNRPEIIMHPASDKFCELLSGQAITGMERRGKFLRVLLESGDFFMLHLRMTGCLLLTPPDYPQEKHTHLIFHLSGDRELRFSDVRRFGRFWFLRKGEMDTYSGIDKLGIEPFDNGLTAAYLQARFGKRKKAIKECLLDQNVVAGIGNIYSDEILFTAGIHPKRPANSLENKEWQTLAAVIPERLVFFIEKNALTPEEYLAGKGQDYRNTPFLQVYGRSGECCPKCKDTLCRMVIGGRSSVYCPSCQKGHTEEVFSLPDSTDR
ncbi:MAG: bifunctional DNA-formamidopyrimidine glycosylase/DNA-(apurinic or apyrimidinic site) lyase [Roseburia sp.]|nr:bifunctional DNA-formamidopyrimidine glycosylase/DNA-(apurinic or apyrimidinic site) lyase [Roseburia sp.]MCM1243695.1 bifunctional DNA-formamidopyrimidine glycosylase/DNA-(apurinic or apyrimidinic site) lyase [Roseburia sp.]